MIFVLSVIRFFASSIEMVPLSISTSQGMGVVLDADMPEKMT